MILLDTHMWIWANLAPEKLPSVVAEAFDRNDAAVAISTVSVWETMVAIEKGRVSVAATPESTVRSWLESNPFQVMPLELETVILSRTLHFQHDDPADRFIAATAYHLGCPLATVDDRLRKLSWLAIM